ncbi:MAG: hypothetical protein GY757_28770 [bacterium]|nr:hypothetical protein [bacterium]
MKKEIIGAFLLFVFFIVDLPSIPVIREAAGSKKRPVLIISKCKRDPHYVFRAIRPLIPELFLPSPKGLTFL